MNDTPDISAEQALQRLKDGNERFLAGTPRAIGPPIETLARLSRGQQPFAAILGCTDSRVPPELIFDAGLGELFVVRIAGNVPSPEVAGSLQYACTYLHTPLLVVLGHQRCGAIEAALDTKFKGTRLHSRMQLLVDGILPALAGLDARLPPPLRFEQAVEINVRRTLCTLLDTLDGRTRHAGGRMKIVGAIYQMETGRVRFLEAAESV